MYMQINIVAPCFFVMSHDDSSMAFAQVFEGKGRAAGGKQTSIHFAAPPAGGSPQAQEKKANAKREKPAKMFAHKSRGGRKNFENKQTGRHTSLSKCTR
jgi:hypothetical protein